MIMQKLQLTENITINIILFFSCILLETVFASDNQSLKKMVLLLFASLPNGVHTPSLIYCHLHQQPCLYVYVIFL